NFEFEFRENDVLIEELKQNPRLIVFDELLRQVSEEEDEEYKRKLEQILNEMREMRAGVIMPLPASEGISGIAVLGEKKGGDAFTSGDINTLETLMYQAGVAVENASLFSEVQEFNSRLRKEVARATDDLARKNQSLTILRHLDQVIINSLGIKEMAQKIVDTVSWELGYKGGFMILMDKSKKNLRAAALSNTPHYQKAMEMLPISLTDYVLPVDADPTNFIIRAIQEQKVLYTDDFKDLYVPAISAEFSDQIQKAIGSRHNLVYPLISRDEVLGVLIFELNKSYASLSEHEKQLLEAFMDETGIAINNAMLYEESQELNEKLRNANQRLRELDLMKDELVSVASHELRTPMTAIKGYLWMALNKQRDNLNEKLLTYLQRSYDSSERLIELVNDMLSASRLDGKRIELDPKEIELETFIPTILDDLMPKANEKNIKLEFKKPKEMPIVRADEIRLREILMNLTGNALKYTDSGRVWLTVESLPAHQEGIDIPMVQIDIHDTGKGIKKADLGKLFTKFGKLQQGSFVKSSEEGGTGLGLYITKGLVELHGGRIWAESDGKTGTTFSFTIPQA
ncbi:GAF domain-containing sensor histidine kinase, partial [candidate division WWE3 bacterium]|nr:GAF domain-containing sensor histidine kinase [candidate division WWE3 bacterium]